MPRLLPKGRWLLDRRSSAITPVNPDRRPAIELENVGSGPALVVQWEVATAAGTGEGTAVPLTRTYLPKLVPGETKLLWHTRSDDGFQVGDGWHLVLWYDDILGHHYRAVFEPFGEEWKPTEGGMKRKRPAMFESSPL